MNDEPCMCGTRFDCEADNHIMGTTRAAAYLNMSRRGIRKAVERGRLTPETPEPGVLVKVDGEWLFTRTRLDAYNDKRRQVKVAHRA